LAALAYERHGSGERVALLHGANQSARSWRRVSEELATTCEVLAVDLPFHGRSAEVAVRDVPELGALLGETVGRATYVGYFVGGRGAIELALASPDALERLVVIGSVAGVGDPATRQRRLEEQRAIIERLEAAEPAATAYFRESIEARLRRPDFFLDAEGEAIERAANLENTPRGLAQFHRHLGLGPADRHGRLAELEMPVLVVAGALAPPFVALGEELVELIGRNATLAVLDDAGHPAPFERPNEFAGILRDWMAAETP